MHTALHDIAAAIVIVGIVIGVVRIIIVIVAVVGIRPEASHKYPSPAPVMIETASVEAAVMESTAADRSRSREAASEGR